VSYRCFKIKAEEYHSSYKKRGEDSMKTVWMTALMKDEELVKKTFSQMKTYGVEVKGHFWEDDLEKMAWIGPREEMLKPEVSLWAIAATPDTLALPTIRYGLSLLAITVQAKRGNAFPIMLLIPGDRMPAVETLPMPLKTADLLSVTDPGLGAKLVAKIHTPVKEMPSEYRLDVYGNQQIGQWFEVGPMGVSWQGCLFGVSGGEILFHGVGPKGSLPSRSVLNYPMKGLKLDLGGREYNAWAVRNELGANDSYFIKVKGSPDSILFGPYSEQEDAEVFTIKIM
jgi:hypothetical protein